MQIYRLTNYLLSLFPLSKAENWDPSGFSYKHNLRNQLKKNITMSIDLTPEVIQEAIKNDSNLIITHHPFKFYSTWEKEFELAPYKVKILNQLRLHKINVLCLHTNYDSYKEGTSYQIIKKLGFEKDYSRNYYLESHYPAVFNFDQKASSIVELVKNKLGYYALRTNLNETEMNQKIKKVAVLSGSGFIGDILKFSKLGIDLFLTSDIPWMSWLIYKEQNIKIIELPHLDEEVFAPHLSSIIKNKFPDLAIEIVKISEPYRNIK
ncbi:Nif3-like dinuclear metal center hexameric protein [Mycoplasmopsis opalescens]|uniref:Nif3-like dinuclear metal center hexameric protein n=1 Tax=Mycoplasmopsis opalescens TaxID=114886 RepID=UPI0004A7196E|nr:Nif3-like dinuclear metal center hexameric protein [Mycoplasmopsis opalescens]